MSSQVAIEKYTKRILLNNNVGHAYLLEVDDSYNTEIAIEFVKKILEKSIVDLEKLKSVFNQIDNFSFQDLKIIKPDGKQIKKEQIFNLITEYKNKSINNLKRFYIIEYAEDLNLAAGNSLLKFLEEPENDIVAILVTKNIYAVLETLVSRCQILNLNNYISTTFNEENILLATNFLKRYEEKAAKSIAYLSELYLLKSDELKNIFIIWSKIYENVLNFKITKKIKINCVEEEIKKISEKNDKKEIINKIKQIDELVQFFDSNVNTRVILDRFFIGGDNHEFKSSKN